MNRRESEPAAGVPADAASFSPTKAMCAWMEAIAPYGILVTDRDLRIRSWNDWLVRHSGRTAPFVVGQRLIELYPELAARRLDQHYARALAGEIIVLSTALHKYLLPFSSTVPQSTFPHMLQTVRIAPLLEDGSVVGTITVIEDVTQREVQSAILQRQQEIDRLLSGALAVLLLSSNPGGEIAGIFSTIGPVIGLDAFVNYLLEPDGLSLRLHAAGGISPRQRASIVSLALTEADRRALCSASAPPEMNIAGHADNLSRLGLRGHCSFPLAAGDRTLGLVAFASYERETIAAPDVATMARIARYVAVALDRSLREREILAASRAKDDFLAALSHELRTPLNPVLLLASDGGLNPEYPPAARESFRVIEKNVMLEARLIDDLLDLTRIEHGKLMLELKPIHLHAILRDAIEAMRREFEERRLTLEIDLVAETSLIAGDAVRLQQVFRNVLKNALKFTPAGGRVSVVSRAEPEAHEIVVKISDTGIGMDEKELARVFEAFAQGDHARGGRSHRFGGLGLGLAISRKLMTLHRGRIEAASAGKNLGSTFTLRVPSITLAQQTKLAAGTREWHYGADKSS